MKIITMWMFYKNVTVLNQMCQIQIVWKIGYNFCTIVDKCKIINVIIYCQNASEVQMQNNVCEWILDILKMALFETKEKQKKALQKWKNRSWNCKRKLIFHECQILQ